MSTGPRAREGDEPEEAPRPIPLAFLAFMGVVGLWGAGYFLVDIGDQSDWMGDGRSAAAMAPAVVEAVAGEVSGPVDGGQIFAARCVACHQATGMGIAGVFPPLGGSEWVAGPPERLVHILLRGLSGEVQVSGAVYNGVMPSFREPLSDAEIAAVLTHIRSSFGNTASVVDEALVAAVRDSLDADTSVIAGQEALSRIGE